MDQELSKTMVVTEAIRHQIVEPVREAAEGRARQKFEQFVATSYREKKEVNLSSYYFVKVDVGGGKFVHLRVYQEPPQGGICRPPKFEGIQQGHTVDDEITHFG